MSDNVQIVSIVITFLGTVFTGVMAYMMAKLNRGQKDAAVKADEVKQTLVDNTVVREQQFDDLKQVTKDTHTLVNSNFGTQLSLTASSMRRIADTTKSAADVEAAETAERLYTEHMAKQATVDAGEST